MQKKVFQLPIDFAEDCDSSSFIPAFRAAHVNYTWAVVKQREQVTRNTWASLTVNASNFLNKFAQHLNCENNLINFAKQCPQLLFETGDLLLLSPSLIYLPHAIMDMQNTKRCNALANARVNFSKSEKSSLPHRGRGGRGGF